MLRKAWLWMLMLGYPAVAYAASSVNVSGYLRPFVVICVVVICYIGVRWALRYWANEIGQPLGKILMFAATVIAVIIVVVILLGLAGINLV